MNKDVLQAALQILIPKEILDTFDQEKIGTRGRLMILGTLKNIV